MQTKIIRGARRLLVTAGVITLVCSVVAPAAVSASNAGGNGQGAEGGPAQAQGHGQGAGEGGGHGHDGGVQPAGEQGADKVWVCHRTASVEVNPWELVEVAEDAVQVHADHHEDVWFTDGDALAALDEFVGEVLGLDGVEELHQSDVQQLADAQLAALTVLCTADGATDGDDEEIVEEEVVEEEVVEEEVVEEEVVEDEVVEEDELVEEIDDDTDDDTEEPQGPRGPKPIQVRDDEVTPPAPLPEPQISADEVVAPPAPAGNPEVLGVTTTRIPTRELASGAGVTSLPRTGTDSTTFLALVGGLLVATGVGLEALGRRGHLAAAGGRR